MMMCKRLALRDLLLVRVKTAGRRLKSTLDYRRSFGTDARQASAAYLVFLADASSLVPTYSAAGPNDSVLIANLRHQTQSGDATAVNKFWNAVHKHGTPLVEEIPGEKNFSFLIFLWHGNDETRNVVIFDGVAGFDAKDRTLHLDGRDVWYKTYRVRNVQRRTDALSLELRRGQ
jgi:hypothetical protein